MNNTPRKYDAYKDTGISWLGDVPVHWEVKKAKYFTKIITGNSIKDEHKNQYANNDENSIPYISTKDVTFNYQIDFSYVLYIPKSDFKNFRKSEPDSIFLCVEGGSAGRKIAYSENSLFYVNKLANFKSQHNNKFLYYFLKSKSFIEEFNLNMEGLIGGVSTKKIENFLCICPPINEQKAIAEFLDKETAKIDKTIDKANELITKLTEYRTSLITHAVTGKIKVV